METAKDIMSTDVVTLAPDTDIVSAAQTLLSHHINGAPVLDADGRLVGILCQSDLVAQQKKLPLPTVFTFLDGIFSLPTSAQHEKELRKIAAMTVADAMTRDPIVVAPDNRLDTVATLMVDHKLHTLPVMDGDRLVGVIGKEDILRTIIKTENA